MEKLVELFMDSGAYSAWTRGTSIELGEYIEFLQERLPLLGEYFNLDVIGGERGARRTPETLEYAATKSYENLVLMKREGLRPIPVFHQQERWYHLERILNEDNPYIAISPYEDLSKNEQAAWFDKVFSLLTDDKGLMKVKVHGLGVSGFSVLRRYPWTTTDATSYVLMAAYGFIWMPRRERGNFQYQKSPLSIYVAASREGKSSKTVPYSYAQMKGIEKELVHKYLEEVGTSIEDCQNSWEARLLVNVKFMLKFQETIEVVPYTPARMVI